MVEDSDHYYYPVISEVMVSVIPLQFMTNTIITLYCRNHSKVLVIRVSLQQNCLLISEACMYVCSGSVAKVIVQMYMLESFM